VGVLLANGRAHQENQSRAIRSRDLRFFADADLDPPAGGSRYRPPTSRSG
jgi:hypothetical protein